MNVSKKYLRTFKWTVLSSDQIDCVIFERKYYMIFYKHSKIEFAFNKRAILIKLIAIKKKIQKAVRKDIKKQGWTILKIFLKNNLRKSINLVYLKNLKL